ncbi:MAG: hypothetical protein HFH86_04685 [Bacilli bacterium]|jgi:hypothetical protein|nr:hypothetical protein [Bacilli bacterium]
MKKIILLLMFLFFFSGCSNLKEESLDSILNLGVTSNVAISNVNRTGYKYYLPKGIKNIDSKDYNEIIYSDKYPFYLYVDVVSYFNKVQEKYVEKNDFFYSKAIYYQDKYGYLQIHNILEDKYFVEIMYNYAKIEVIVTEKDIRETVAYAIAILESITYNDTVLGSLMGENVLNSNELEFNIFETAKSESNYLEFVEQYDQYKNNDEVPDMDFIK